MSSAVAFGGVTATAHIATIETYQLQADWKGWMSPGGAVGLDTRVCVKDKENALLLKLFKETQSFRIVMKDVGLGGVAWMEFYDANGTGLGDLEGPVVTSAVAGSGAGNGQWRRTR